jgi:soluble lytic murein transglycosylase-like protein
MLIRALAVTSLVAVLLPRPVEAQDSRIYVWRDASGKVMLTDRQVEAPTRVYEVPGAPDYVTTRPVEAGAAGRYDGLITQFSRQRSLRPELVRAVIHVESGFDPRARSPKGAMGLMQLMPHTARELGVRDPYDPEDNIRGGTKYLRQLLDKYDGREELALAAYNAGPGAVDRYDEAVPPYRETRDYVRKVTMRAGPTEDGERQATKRTLYRSIEIRDGRVIPRISDRPPTSGTYEIIGR